LWEGSSQLYDGRTLEGVIHALALLLGERLLEVVLHHLCPNIPQHTRG
jgi:hypothetical protein